MSRLYTLDGAVVSGVPPELALYPYGVFTTFVAVDGSVRRWPRHVERLTQGALRLWGHRVDEDLLRQVTRAHLGRLDGPSTVRVTLFPEHLPLAAPAEARGCRTLVSSGPAELPYRPQREIAVASVAHERDLPDLKSTSLLMPIHLRRQAQLAGFDDALLCHGDRVLEGSTWTVMVWADGEVATPDGPVLRSITADDVAGIATSLGWTCSRRPVDRGELVRADLVLAVNANSPARAIGRLDDDRIAVAEDLLDAIAAAYTALPRDRV